MGDPIGAAYFQVKQENERLRARVEFLEQWRNGCLPDCSGNDGTKCGCGYLQGQAYRDLRARVGELEAELDKLKKFKDAVYSITNNLCGELNKFLD